MNGSAVVAAVMTAGLLVMLVVPGLAALYVKLWGRPGARAGPGR